MDKKILVVYFSTSSNNTHRFVQKLNWRSVRIPLDGTPIKVNEDYILIVPTYCGGRLHMHGAVTKQVIQFLNDKDNRSYCRGVISSGNTNFGDQFAVAGPIISKKLHVPFLYQFELLGTMEDVENVLNILKTERWKQNNDEN
ncbi:MAG: class Ib ribonucleoside-diphosphate reductase assembly flavoprotein NrdI [Lactobacillus iners]|nr:class Ib ribonucleoside-diphosphate reductase assembly flavoprotein NrdI [Lactobacillus iners]